MLQTTRQALFRFFSTVPLHSLCNGIFQDFLDEKKLENLVYAKNTIYLGSTLSVLLNQMLQTYHDDRLSYVSIMLKVVNVQKWTFCTGVIYSLTITLHITQINYSIKGKLKHLN